MFARYRQLYAEVRRSYTPEKAREEAHDEFAAWLIYRPLSFAITPLFLLAGFTADAVTALGGVLAVAMLAVALWGGTHGYWGVVALGLFIQVLDCVDGNVARVTRRSSPVGGMLDGLCTPLFWALYFATVGALAHGADAGWIARHGRELGLALAALLLAQREMEDTFDNVFRERVRWEPPVPAALPRFDLKRWAKPLEQLLAFGGLAVAGGTGHLPLFLAGLALYQLAVFALWLPRFVRAVAQRSKETKPLE